MKRARPTSITAVSSRPSQRAGVTITVSRSGRAAMRAAMRCGDPVGGQVLVLDVDRALGGLDAVAGRAARSPAPATERSMPAGSARCRPRRRGTRAARRPARASARGRIGLAGTSRRSRPANARGPALPGPRAPGPRTISIRSWNGGRPRSAPTARRGSRGRWAGVSQRPEVRSMPPTKASLPSITTSFSCWQPPAGCCPSSAAYPLPGACLETPPWQRLAVEAVEEEPVPDQQPHLEFGAARRQAAEEVAPAAPGHARGRARGRR